jgi:hypothetical protein
LRRLLRVRRVSIPRARCLEWPARVLAGLDCSFVVRRPAELRDALEQRAEKIATLAKRTERAASSEKAANSRAGESSPADWRA